MLFVAVIVVKGQNWSLKYSEDKVKFYEKWREQKCVLVIILFIDPSSITIKFMRLEILY